MAFIVLLERTTTVELVSTIGPELFSGRNVWLFKSGDKMLEYSYFPIDSQVFTFTEDDERIEIEELYNVDNGMEQVVNHLGSWQRNGGLALDPLPLFERRKDFLGYQFKAETMNEPPYAVVNAAQLLTEEETQIGGIWGEIWHGTLEKTMNFTTSIEPSPDRQWGSMNEDGTWNGIINGLIQNRTQVGLTSFYFTHARGMVADFSPAITEGTDQMFIKYPGREASWTTYIEPFDFYLWVSLFFLLALMTFCLASTYLFGPERNLNPDSFHFQNSILVICGSQVGQGSWLDPKSLSSKLVFLTSFLFGVIIITSFSAKLISFLTVIKLTLPFTSLHDIQGTAYSLGSVKGTALVDNFLYAPPNSIEYALAESKIRKDPSNMVGSIEEGLAKAKFEKYAFIWTTDVIFELNKDNCDFLNIPYDVDTGLIAMAWSKQLPHRHFFNYFISKMKETGQLDRILKKWQAKPREDCGSAGKFVSMGIENMISGFAMIGLAMVIAACIAFLEITGSGKWKVQNATDEESKTLL